MEQKAVKPHSCLWFVLFSVLFAVQIIPRFWGDSLTNDEPMEITNGYFYLTHGDVLSHFKHPPFSKALEALPLLALHLNEPQRSGDAIDRAYAFFFRANPGRLQAMTLGGRLSSLLLGWGIGILLFRITRRRPLPVFLCALGLWAFDPTISAFAGLAMADIAVSFFFLASVLAFQRSQETGSWKSALLAGVLSGMAVTCKFSALVLLPVYLILEIAPYLGKFRKPLKSKDWHFLRSRWFGGLGGFGLWVFLIYLPGTFALPDHLSPFRYFWDGFQDMAHYHGHPVYFMGRVGPENHWAYFPVAFLLKNPLPFLGLLGLGFVLAVLHRLSSPLWQWLPGLLFFAAILPTQDLGIRYLLPAYPFFILVAAGAFGWLWEKAGSKPFWKIPLAGLALFQVASVGLNFPHAISYFNETVSPEGKFYWLGDSNLDIGQDLGRLAELAREDRWGKVKLAYLGGADPSAYGLNWEPWREEDLKAPQPGSVYAVNASFIQLAPAFYPESLPVAAGWLSQAAPSGKVNDTWYYYRIPGTPKPGAGPFLSSVPYQQRRGYVPAVTSQSIKTSP